MGHYKVSRLRTRTSSTPPEWLKVVSTIGRQVNEWSGRGDLVVYGGDDSAEGEAVAALYHDIAEIEVNLPKAFGEITKPEFVGDFTQRTNQFEFPVATGVCLHEALHAKYTNWDRQGLEEAFSPDPIVGKMFMSLEESRIERNGVVDFPENREFLRASALSMALEDLTDETLEGASDTWSVAILCLLAMARYDAGVLEASDVARIHKQVLSVLGEELYRNLQKLWLEFQALTVRRQNRAVEVAREFVELLRQADPEGEPQVIESDFIMVGSGEGEGEDSEDEDSKDKGEGKGSGEISEEMAEMLGELERSATNAELNAEDKLQDQKTKERWQDEVKERREVTNAKTNRKSQAKQIFDKRYDEYGSGSNSRISEKRKPTGDERAMAVKLSKALERAKYRERSEHTIQSVLPMGKLNVRNAIQNQALEARGQMPTLPSWKRKTRKHTDDPTLKLGVMVDISGSMGNAMEAMATTAWVLGEAGHRIQAETAMMYFGTGVFPTLRKGQRLPEVNVYSAPDGTEEFGKAWEALDGELELTFGTGVRMLVVVSDCQFTGKQTPLLDKALAECKKSGVAVLIVSPQGCWAGMAKNAIERANYGIHLDDLPTNEIPEAIGKSAIRELQKIGGQS